MTQLARIGLFTRVGSHVHRQVNLQHERLAALLAAVRPFLGVGSHVDLEVPISGIVLLAYGARHVFDLFLARVLPHVVLEC